MQTDGDLCCYTLVPRYDYIRRRERKSDRSGTVIGSAVGLQTHIREEDRDISHAEGESEDCASRRKRTAVLVVVIGGERLIRRSIH